MFEKLIEAARTCYESGNPIDACCIEDCPNFDSQPYCLDQILKDCAEALTQSGAELKDKDYLIQQQADEIQRLKADVNRQQEKMFDLAKKLPKQGEWLIHSTGGSMATKKCPFCGSESGQSKEYAKVPKYCQNCGAHLPTFKIMDWVDYLYAKTEVQE